MKAGFEKTGIYPLDRDKVLSMIPSGTAEFNNDELSESLVDFLKQMRYRSSTRQVQQRRVKLNVKAGRSVTAQSDSEEEDEDITENSETSDSNDHENQDQMSESGSEDSTNKSSDAPEPNINIDLESIHVGTWMLVELETMSKTKKRFVGEVLGIRTDESHHYFNMTFLKPYSYMKTYFEKPNEPLETEIVESEIVKILQEPKKTRRGPFEFGDVDRSIGLW